MKTSTVLVVALLFVLYTSMGQRAPGGSAPALGTAPQSPQQQPQSGGGDTFNQVLGLITAGLNTAGRAIDLAEDRSGPA